MTYIAVDKNGALLGKVSPGVDLTQTEIDAGVLHIEVDQAEYWKRFDMQQVASQTYKTKRAAEYPPIQDYLDDIVKGDTAQVQKYIADCLAVKAKIPKA